MSVPAVGKTQTRGSKRSMLPHYANLMTITSRVILVCAITRQGDDVSQQGHLQPFGQSGPKLQVEVRSDYPEPLEFFSHFVLPRKPLRLTGVTSSTRAAQLWTDDYLLSRDVQEMVLLETKKKENRSQETIVKPFSDFLKLYNDSEYYMVNSVPRLIRSDVTVPFSLQCPPILEKAMSMEMMWFSSGGTKSVVHTDDMDNIICVFRGTKTFVMVDPDKHTETVYLNKPGSYSDLDVDSVDLNEYPELANVEFYHVNLSAGDCLYIPYLWIHQVRSYNSNVAVNFWWDHNLSIELTKAGLNCSGKYDLSLTLDRIIFWDATSDMISYQPLRDWFENVLKVHKQLNQQQFLEKSLEVLSPEVAGIINQVMVLMDANKDEVYTLEEVQTTPDSVWEQMHEKILQLNSLYDKHENSTDFGTNDHSMEPGTSEKEEL